MISPRRSLSRLSRRIFGLLCIALLAGGVLLLSKIGYIAEAEHWTADWRTAILSMRKPSQDEHVALVLISEETLQDYPVRIPMDRSMIAKLIRTIASAHPAAIGVDFVFARPTNPTADAELLSAIRESDATIILGSVDDRMGLTQKQLEYHRQFLGAAKRPIGHVFFERKTNVFGISDRAIREMVEPPRGANAEPSFAEVLARIVRRDARPRTRLIAWLLQPYDGSQTFYEVEASDLLGPPEDAAPLLTGLQGKIVLVGSDLVDLDRHLTPLSVVNEERMPGVRIHAQIVAQLIDGRWLRRLYAPEEFLTLLSIALAGYAASRTFGITRFPMTLASAGSAAFVIAGAFSFKFFGLLLPYTTALTAWVASVSLAERADKMHNKIFAMVRFITPNGRLKWHRICRLSYTLGLRYWRG